MTTKTFTHPHNPFLPEDAWKFDRIERDRKYLLNQFQRQRAARIQEYHVQNIRARNNTNL